MIHFVGHNKRQKGGNYWHFMIPVAGVPNWICRSVLLRFETSHFLLLNTLALYQKFFAFVELTRSFTPACFIYGLESLILQTCSFRYKSFS